MDRTERFYKIDQQLRAKKVVSFAALRELLGVSRATLRRDLDYMRDRLCAGSAPPRCGAELDSHEGRWVFLSARYGSAAAQHASTAVLTPGRRRQGRSRGLSPTSKA